MEVRPPLKRYVCSRCSGCPRFLIDIYVRLDESADAPRRQAAAEWRDWTNKVKKFIPAVWEGGLPVQKFEIADGPFTPESGLIYNGESSRSADIDSSCAYDDCRLL